VRHTIRMTALALLLFAFASRVEAVPTLQLGIVGGFYDSTGGVETVMSGGSVFDLVALLTPDQNSHMSDYYYISAAVVPKTGPTGADIGSFIYDGATVSATTDMTYGRPPLDTIPETDQNLQQHSIYDTFFSEFEFQFTGTQTTTTYNTQEHPGLDPALIPGTQTYWAKFAVDTSGLDPGYQLHFDLYNVYLKQCSAKGKTCDQTTLDKIAFAPFSHDAQSSPPVPEPASMILFGTGLVAAAVRKYKLNRG
jgi:PEP-CTERM motif-containing protein